MLLFVSTALAGFGGAELGVVGESDTAGAELLLAVGVTPWSQESGQLRLDFVHAEVDWGPLDRTFDGVRAAALAGQVTFSSGRAGATFGAGDFVWDPELAYYELGIVRGGMGGELLDERLSWGLGADVHARFQKETALYLGVPLHLGFEQPMPGRTFVGAGVLARPKVGLVGPRRGAFDGLLSGEAGLHAIDEEEAQLDVVLAYTGQLDTATDAGAQMVNRLGLGVRARF